MSTEEPTGTELYQKWIVAFNQEDQRRYLLMREVWDQTPWIVDAYTGSSQDSRCEDIRQWCGREWGQESFPIHRKVGTWASGSATVFGWTWYGFATEEMMAKFLERWPPPEGVEKR